MRFRLRTTLLFAACVMLADVAAARAGEVRLWSRVSGFSRFCPPPEQERVPLSPMTVAGARAPGGGRALSLFLRAYSFAPFTRNVQRPGVPQLYPARPSVAPDGPFFANYTEEELVCAVYAETGGLFPRRIAEGSIYDAATWADDFDAGSVYDLRCARRMVAEARKSNKRTHLRARPPASDRLATRAWLACEQASKDAMLREVYPIEPGERLHFFIRQDGEGAQKAPYLYGYEPVVSYGPFVNVGGGDVPAGAATYLDFYVLPARGR